MSEAREELARNAAAMSQRNSPTASPTMGVPSNLQQLSEAASTAGLAPSEKKLGEEIEEIARACVNYSGDVLQYTSEASRAVAECRSFPELIDVQTQFMRASLQAFLDCSVTIAEAAGHLMNYPLALLRPAEESASR